LTVCAHRRKSVVTQDFQMLGYRRLTDRELALYDGADLARRQFTIGEQLEDAASHRIPKDIERVHIDKLKVLTYISQVYYIKASINRRT
jgi:hypothetical protein